MFSIKEFSEDLDLTKFYKTAEERGYYNNCNQTVLHDNMKHLNDYKTYLLYWSKTVVGSVCLHSLEELNILGDNAYRIGVRTCMLSHLIDGPKALLVQNYRRAPMNHYTSQFLLPMCIKYCGADKPLYISTNDNEAGSQLKVHRTWATIMNKLGYLDDPIELDYRNNFQNFWKLNTEFYLQNWKNNLWKEAEFLAEDM